MLKGLIELGWFGDMPDGGNGCDDVSPIADQPVLGSHHEAVMTFQISGQMPSGKNQVQLAIVKGRVLKFPNKRFKAWREGVVPVLMAQRSPGYVWPIRTPVKLSCRYTPGDNRTRDVSGLLDALFHVIVKAGIVMDDGQVRAVEWHPCALDRDSPGLAFQVEVLRV